MIRSLLSETEIECLRSILGVRIDGIFSQTLAVYEENVRLLPPASVRIEDGRDFLVIEPTRIPFVVDGREANLGYRPKLHISNTPPSILWMSSPKQVIPGPCSVFDLGQYFRVTSIDIFQRDSVVNVIDRDISFTMDVQITLFRGEGSPLSIAASLDAVYVSRNMGLAMDRSLRLERRMTLK